MQPTLLVVDDDTSNLASLVRIFEKLELRTLAATNGQEALSIIRQKNVGVILTDLMMPQMSGIELLQNAKVFNPDVEVVLMTAYGTIERAVAAMREGAYDFVTKPFRRAEIERTVTRAIEKLTLVAENRALKAQLADARNRKHGGQIIGNAPALRHVLDTALQAAPSTATVLLMGESGTGKELFARAIHQQSPRAEKPLVTVNCSALPESVIEAELFGAEKGAFTGAHVQRDGRFTRANGGTIFLDEIGELSPQIQVKILRVLQSGDYERVGGQQTLFTDCRVIAATNRDLPAAVHRGDFREDLFYRLNVIPIIVPPLRARRDDIPLLADYFVRHYAEQNGKPIEGIAPSALQKMVDYSWPGNVRELQNTIERAVVLAKKTVLNEADLPEAICSQVRDAEGLSIPIGTPLDEIERRAIQETLRFTNGDKKRAAQLLGIATRTIYRKLDNSA
ncbi:MAG: sigma-54-dependent transcriptional regulator [Bradymonadia bacterium]